jgi:hypothetical protein
LLAGKVENALCLQIKKIFVDIIVSYCNNIVGIKTRKT